LLIPPFLFLDYRAEDIKPDHVENMYFVGDFGKKNLAVPINDPAGFRFPAASFADNLS
jgi:hypothetical protein